MPEKDGKSEMLTTKTKKSTKVPKLKISLDGELKGAKGKKIVFKDSDDNEGEEEGMVDGEEDQKQRIERHAVRLRERIDKGRKEVTLFIMCLHMISVIATGTSNFSRNFKKYFLYLLLESIMLQDDERERQRIRDKHRNKRLLGKLPLSESAAAGVMLGSGSGVYPLLLK
jgi:hypothetical protein